MFKKILCLALAVMMLMSVAVIASSAAQIEVVENAADVPAEVGADSPAEVSADAPAETGAANTISFDPASAGWQNFDYISFHIWAIDDDSFSGYDWGGKKQRGKDTDGDGVWTYDLDNAGLTIQSGKQYCVIFYASTGVQTYNLLFGAECIGHVARCDGTEYENPEDSTKTAKAAFWDGIDSKTYGPELKISSIGTVVGTCCPASTTPYEMFKGFLTNTLGNARTFSGKADQALLDDTAKALGLGQDLIKQAISETGVSVEWKEADSSAEATSDSSATQQGGQNGGSQSGSGSGSSSGSGSGSGSSSSSSSSSSSKSGSGSTSKTGQETTVLFIMLGVMVAAAGVIFFVRKRERA
jgi:LPXTG-motif cell wall-anchored protein